MGPSYQYRAQVIRWVDGDTVDCVVDLGFTVQVRERFRLSGVNTPETNRKASREAGNRATEFVVDLCPVGSTVIVQTERTGKFGRWLATVYPTDGSLEPGVSVNDALLSSGHAVPYP